MATAAVAKGQVETVAREATPRPGILDRLEVPPKPRGKNGNTLHIMFTLSGQDAQDMRGLMEQARITNISAWVKGLVARDLRARLNGNGKQ